MDKQAIAKYSDLIHFGNPKQFMREHMSDRTPDDVMSISLDEIIDMQSSLNHDEMIIIPESKLDESCQPSSAFKRNARYIPIAKMNYKDSLEKRVHPKELRRKAYDEFFKKDYYPVIGCGFESFRNLMLFFHSQEMRGLMDAAFYAKNDIIPRIANSQQHTFEIDLFSDSNSGKVLKDKNIDELTPVHKVILAELTGFRRNHTQFYYWSNFKFEINSHADDYMAIRDSYLRISRDSDNVKKGNDVMSFIPDFHVFSALFLRTYLGMKEDISSIPKNDNFRPLYRLSCCPWMLYNNDMVDYYMKIKNNTQISFASSDGKVKYRKPNVKDNEILLSKKMHMLNDFDKVFVNNHSLTSFDSVFDHINKYWEEDIARKEKLEPKEEVVCRPDTPVYLL